MSELQRESGDVPPAPGQETDKPASDEIDKQALADKVYELLVKEARLERERLGRRRA